MLREHGRAANETFHNVWPTPPRYIRTKCCRQARPLPQPAGRPRRTNRTRKSIKIPFFMRWPANIYSPIGVDAGRYVANIDLTPTAAAATGASAGPMDGRSLYRPHPGPHLHRHGRMERRLRGDLGGQFRGRIGNQLLPLHRSPTSPTA